MNALLNTFVDVDSFVYDLERTGRDTEPVILEDRYPDDVPEIENIVLEPFPA